MAIGKEDGIVGTIVTTCKALGIHRREVLNALARSQYVMPQGMTSEEHVLKLIVYQLGR